MNEQTIDAIMIASANLVAAEIHNANLPSVQRKGYCLRLEAALRDRIAAALAAKDVAMGIMEAESAAMADALKQIAEAVGLGVGHTAAEIVAAVTAKYAEIERLKAQLAEPAEPAPGEWIEWAGGECPLKDSVRHSIRKRDGWQSAPDIAAADWYGWRHNGSSADIVAYRVLA